jgi:hypothetical protein
VLSSIYKYQAGHKLKGSCHIRHRKNIISFLTPRPMNYIYMDWKYINKLWTVWLEYSISFSARMLHTYIYNRERDDIYIRLLVSNLIWVIHTNMCSRKHQVILQSKYLWWCIKCNPRPDTNMQPSSELSVRLNARGSGTVPRYFLKEKHRIHRTS